MRVDGVPDDGNRGHLGVGSHLRAGQGEERANHRFRPRQIGLLQQDRQLAAARSWGLEHQQGANPGPAHRREDFRGASRPRRQSGHHHRRHLRVARDAAHHIGLDAFHGFHHRPG